LYELAQVILRKEKDQKYCIMDGSYTLTMPQVTLQQCSNSWPKKEKRKKERKRKGKKKDRNCTHAIANVFARPCTL
jgi:diaminopimelate decarboxylase